MINMREEPKLDWEPPYKIETGQFQRLFNGAYYTGRLIRTLLKAYYGNMDGTTRGVRITIGNVCCTEDPRFNDIEVLIPDIKEGALERTLYTIGIEEPERASCPSRPSTVFLPTLKGYVVCDRNDGEPVYKKVA